MEASPQRHLHPVEFDPRTGEIIERACPKCLDLKDKLKGAERDLNGWRARYADLQRDKERDARADELWPEATNLFRLYCHLTGKPGKPRKLTWNAERFELVRPFLKKHGPEMCARAIIGRVSDHFTSQRANGSTIHYHEWERTFGSKGQGQTCASNFEESCNRAPADWKEQRAALLAKLEPKSG